jgi:hypothetical protein
VQHAHGFLVHITSSLSLSFGILRCDADNCRRLGDGRRLIGEKLMSINLSQNRVPLSRRVGCLTERIVTPFAVLSFLGGGGWSIFSVLLCLLRLDEEGFAGMPRYAACRLTVHQDCPLTTNAADDALTRDALTQARD